jgi:hypothetical protein
MSLLLILAQKLAGRLKISGRLLRGVFVAGLCRSHDYGNGIEVGR